MSSDVFLTMLSASSSAYPHTPSEPCVRSITLSTESSTTLPATSSTVEEAELAPLFQKFFQNPPPAPLLNGLPVPLQFVKPCPKALAPNSIPPILPAP